jgi:DNA-binding NarL/FixJ family response regulator
LGRDDLIHRCRILVIDDERPALIDDLTRTGFSVDYDSSGDDMGNVEKHLYDLILLDFGGVGEKYGKDQGLSLLRHIKRINPSQFVLAYTSKSLPPHQSSDFYRLTDGTLSKDAGIQESFEKIEESLKEAVKVDRIWNATLASIPSARDRKQLERAMNISINKRSSEPIRRVAERLPSIAGEKVVEKSIEKVIELVFKGLGAE